MQHIKLYRIIRLQSVSGIFELMSHFEQIQDEKRILRNGAERIRNLPPFELCIETDSRRIYFKICILSDNRTVHSAYV